MERTATPLIESRPSGEISLPPLPDPADRGTFCESVCALRPRLMRVALRVVKNQADAEDVLQEAVWRAFQKLDGYRGEGALSTWLTRITINQAIAHLRRRDKAMDSLDEASSGTGGGLKNRLAASSKSPEQNCIDEESAAIVRAGIRRIRPFYRTVLLWSEWGGMSHQRIADRLGLSAGTVKIRVHRARRQLRLLVARRLSQRPGSARGIGRPLMPTQDLPVPAERVARR